MIASKESFEPHSSEQLPNSKKVFVAGTIYPDVRAGYTAECPNVARLLKNLAFTPEAKLGDYVLVHVGFAISIVDADEAARTYELLEQMDQLTELDAPVVDEVSARKPQ